MITFEEESHEYKADGALVPSVTQLMQKYGVINTKWFNPAARVRGSHVHKATEYHDLGILDYDKLDPVLKPYVDAYIGFRRDVYTKILLSEWRGYDPELGYAGTLDRFIDLKGTRILFDIKTGICPKWAHIQLAAYLNLLKLEGFKVDQCFTLNLQGDGSYRFAQVSTIKIIEGWKYFQALCRTFKISRELGGEEDYGFN